MTEREWHADNAAQEAGELIAANLRAILDEWGCTDVHDLGRTLYKCVSCGPWLSVQLHDGEWRHSDKLRGIGNGNVRCLMVGSIVEGSDAGVEGETLDLLTDKPTEEIVARFESMVEAVDEQASALWREANDEED